MEISSPKLLTVHESFMVKEEKILKGSLDLIPSPSVKIQIIGGKVCLRYKGKTLLSVVNKLLKTKSLLTTPSSLLPLHLKQTFPPIIWIFTEGDGIKSRLPFRIFSTLNKYEYVQSEMRLSLAHFFITLIIWSTWGFEVFLRSWTTSTKDCRSSRPAIIIWKCPIQAPNLEKKQTKRIEKVEKNIGKKIFTSLAFPIFWIWI